MDYPKISVIMSVYKEPLNWLDKSISSILNQTERNFEFIIINDNPTDEQLKLYLKKWGNTDTRIKLLENEQNRGLVYSLNRGLDVARGEFIARMDADDISCPERLRKQLAFLEKHSDVIVLGTKIRYFGSKKCADDWIKCSDQDIKAQLLYGCCFAHPSVVLRASVIRNRSIRYDSSYSRCEDYHLWEVLSNYGKFANLPEKLLMYRQSATQITKNVNKSELDLRKAISDRITANYFSYLGLEIPKSWDEFKLFRKVLLTKLPRRNPYMRILLKKFYFNDFASKHVLFFILKFDFLRIGFYDTLRYLAIVLGLKQPA